MLHCRTARTTARVLSQGSNYESPLSACPAELKDTRRTERTWRRGTRRHDNVSLYVHTAILYQSRVYPKPSHRKLPANMLQVGFIQNRLTGNCPLTFYYFVGSVFSASSPFTTRACVLPADSTTRQRLPMCAHSHSVTKSGLSKTVSQETAR